MFVSQVEVGARSLLNDLGGPSRRYEKARFVDWITQAVRQHSLLRPDLFAAEATLTAAGPMAQFKAGRIYHSAPADSLRLMEVLEYRPAGSTVWTAVNEVAYPQLVDQTAVVGSGATSVQGVNERAGLLYGGSVDDRDTSTTPEWARHPKSPNRFFFTPAPRAGAELRVEYSKIPAAIAPDYNETTLIEDLTDGYLTTMIHCVVWLAESVDDPEVVSGRAEMFRQSFMQSLTGEAQARQIVDDRGQTELTQEQAGG